LTVCVQRGVTLALLSCALLGACASAPRPKQQFVDPAQALQFHQLARERVHSIRAEARVDQRGSEGRIKGTVLMFVERPDRVRFDAMTQFGPAAILTSAGERFAYADLRNRSFLTGVTCPKNIARMLNMPLRVDQTIALLLGGTPVIDHQGSQIEWNDGGFYRITLRGRDGGRQQIDFGISERDTALPPSRQDLKLIRSEIYDRANKSILRAVYDDYRPVAFGTYHIAMPFEVHVEQPQVGADTLIRFKKIDLNVQVPPEAFAQEPPPGTTQEEASCD
jgi:hypothetical protein